MQAKKKVAQRNKTFDEVLSGFSRERRRKIEARAAELIKEEMTLRELRVWFKMTQATMAESTGVRQESISRIESRADVKVSTLRKVVEALGGSLSLVVNFPDRESIALAGIAETKPKRARVAHAPAK